MQPAQESGWGAKREVKELMSGWRTRWVPGVAILEELLDELAPLLQSAPRGCVGGGTERRAGRGEVAVGDQAAQRGERQLRRRRVAQLEYLLLEVIPEEHRLLHRLLHDARASARCLQRCRRTRRVARRHGRGAGCCVRARERRVRRARAEQSARRLQWRVGGARRVHELADRRVFARGAYGRTHPRRAHCESV